MLFSTLVVETGLYRQILLYITLLIYRNKSETSYLGKPSSDYPNLLPEMPRYYYSVEVLLFDYEFLIKDKNKISICFMRPQSRGKCYTESFQRTQKRVTQAGFESRPSRQHSSSILYSFSLGLAAGLKYTI